jgi:hypothetical protein
MEIPVALLKKLFGADHRKDVRYPVDLLASAISRDLRELELHVVNISANGFMCRGHLGLGRGDLLLIELPTIGRRSAFITWSFENRFGGQFERPIPEGELGRLITASWT